MFFRPSFWILAAFGIVTTLVISGCNRRTPEERMQKAVEFLRQNDTLSAEAEAKKVIQKNPDDPVSIQARMLLSQVYGRDQRFDEARAELEPALDKVSQKDNYGRQVLRTYLALLQAEKKYDDALKTIDQFQQKYADDEATSLNLTVARVDTQTMAGYTTAARATLTDLRNTTTSPEEIRLYREMYINTFQRDNDTTGAIEYVEQELAAASTDDEKRGLASRLTEMYFIVDNYDKLRENAKLMTDLYDKGMEKELDARMRAAMTFELAKTYLSVGNLAGARQTFQALFDSAKLMFFS